jgi:cyclopropane fatty-acyl-phospholipid synthase-like methyltransferase
MTPALEPSDEEVAALVREGYDAVATRYASYVANSTEHPRGQWLQQLLSRLRPRSRVLDLGCGPGTPTAAAVVAAGHDVVGIDISGGQLALAREQVPSATFVHADFLDIAFEAGAFDAVVALYSITHVSRRHYAALFERIRTWVEPDGWFLATLGTGDSSGWLEEDFLGFGGTSWTNSFEPATTEQLLREAGLSLESVEIVETSEEWGAERWLHVLARPA